MGDCRTILARIRPCWSFSYTLICIHASWAAGAEPSAEVWVDSAVTTLGQPVELTLRLRYGTDFRPLPPPQPSSLPLDATVIELDAGVPRQSAGGRMESLRRWELRFYQLGIAQLPPVLVSFVDDKGDTLRLPTDPIDIAVGPVRAEDETALRDIKPPIVLSRGVPVWLKVIVVILLVLGIAALGYRLFIARKSSAQELAAPQAPVDYVREFARIAEMGLVDRGALKLHYSLLSDTMRQFLQDRTSIDAPELTTWEIALALPAVLEEDELDAVERFLSEADLVKFAKASPSSQDSLRVPDVGKQIVRDVEARLRRLRAADNEHDEQPDTSVDHSTPEATPLSAE